MAVLTIRGRASGGSGAVDSVNSQTGNVVLDQDDILNGTTYVQTENNFSDTLKTKLDGIEEAADVTDAVNVASSINGASDKTTPVNADKIGFIDSENSNVLKKFTFTNFKAFLKTYFDTLYATTSTVLSAFASPTSTIDFNNQTIDNTKTIQLNGEIDNGTTSSNETKDITLNNGQFHKVTLSAHTITINLKNPTSTGMWLLTITNGGLATLTWSSDSGSIVWKGGTEPSLTSSGTDIIAIKYNGTNFQCEASLDFS